MLFCIQDFYVCSGFKDEKPEIVGLTPDTSLAPAAHQTSSPAMLEALLEYRGVPITRRPIMVYNVVSQNSSLYKKRARAVQEFVAANPEDSLKYQFYLTIRCDGMQKRFGQDWITGKVVSENSFCVVHRCYNKYCLPWYGYEASLLQPKGGLEHAAHPVDELILRRRVFGTLQEEVPSNKKNAVRILHQRSLGVRLRK